MKTITLELRDQRLVMAARPVMRQAFRAYLDAVGKSMPAPLAKGRSATAPVTHVSQTEAQEYCHWLSAQEGRRYRLPALAELHWLAYESTQQGNDMLIWTRQPGPEVHGAVQPAYLCEWTQETEVLMQAEGAMSARALGSIFYLPWAQNSSRMTHIQASLNARERYSFVTFRVVHSS